MAVDYLSTLNSNGSGLNTTQLVDALVAAEVEPKRALLTKEKDATDLSISEMGKLRSAFANFADLMRSPGAGVARVANSSSASVGIEITDYDAITPAADEIEVSSLAAGQVIEFTGFTDPSDVIAEGTLTIDAGTWSGTTFTTNTDVAQQSVTIDSTNATLDGLAAELDALDGVSAKVVAKGDGTYSLSVRSDTGAKNALRINDTSGTLTTFDTADNSEQVLAAQDAQFTYNGLSLSRSSNTITDLIEGTTVTLFAETTSPVALEVIEDESIARGEVTAFISSINTLMTSIDTATKRGINGAKSGPLVGDVTLNAVRRQLSTLTTTPLTGFGDTPIYLSQYGIKTERDGTYSVDREQFETAFRENPIDYRAIFSNKTTSSNADFIVTEADSANPPQGDFDFVYNADGTATLNGDYLLKSQVDGETLFTRYTGDFQGVTINAGTTTPPATSTITFAQSAVDRMADYMTDLLASAGDLTKAEARMSRELQDSQDELADLEDKEQMLASMYRTKFTAMERQITQLKATGTFIKNLTDAWAAQKNQ